AVSFLAAHPIVAGVLAVAAAVGVLAYNMHQVATETDATLARMDAFARQQTRQEFEQSPAAKKILGIQDPEQRQAAAKKELEDAQQELADASRRFGETRQNFFERTYKSAFG